MPRIVNGGEHVRIHVVHGFVLQDSVGKAIRNFPAMPHSTLPLLESAARGAGRLRRTVLDFGKLRSQAAAEAEDYLREILFGDFLAASSDHVLGIDRQHWFSPE